MTLRQLPERRFDVINLVLFELGYNSVSKGYKWGYFMYLSTQNILKCYSFYPVLFLRLKFTHFVIFTLLIDELLPANKTVCDVPKATDIYCHMSQWLGRWSLHSKELRCIGCWGSFIKLLIHWVSIISSLYYFDWALYLDSVGSACWKDNVLPVAGNTSVSPLYVLSHVLADDLNARRVSVRACHTSQQ